MSTGFKQQVAKRLLHPVIRGICTPFLQGLVPVFMLHRMADPARGIRGHDPQFLAQALDWLRANGYRFVSLRELVDATELPRDKLVAFTMDDGFKEQAEVAAPIFLQRECPVTQFLITGFVDRTLWPWDHQVDYIFSETRRGHLEFEAAGQRLRFDIPDAQARKAASRAFREQCKRIDERDLMQAVSALAAAGDIELTSEPPAKSAPMTWDHARCLESKGFCFAPHSVSHRILSRMPSDRAEAEIVDSWGRLQSELQDPLKLFAFPTGRFGVDFAYNEMALLKAHGFAGAVSSDPGYVDLRDSQPNANMPLLRRFSFPDNMDDLIQYCEGIERVKELIRGHGKSNRRLTSRRSRQTALPLGPRARAMDLAWRTTLRLGFLRRYTDIRWGEVERLVFVCKGNICRSAFAEAVAKRDYEHVASCGLSTRGDDPADPSAQAIARRFCIDLSHHRTQPISQLEIRRGDLLLTMDPQQATLLRRAGLPAGAQVSLLGLWGRTASPHIPDPYAREDAFFENCFALIQESVAGIMEHLRASTKPVASPTSGSATCAEDSRVTETDYRREVTNKVG